MARVKILRRVAFAVGGIVLAYAAWGTVLRIRARSLLDEVFAEANRRVRDTGPLPRPALLEPAEPGDASTEYRNLFSKEPLRNTSEYRTYSMWFWPSTWQWDEDSERAEVPAWAPGVRDRVLALAHQPLVSTLEDLVGDLDPDRGSPASVAAFWLTLAAWKPITPQPDALRYAAAALVVDVDWQLAGGGDTWKTPDSTLGALDAVGLSVARGARDGPALATVARVLDGMASRPIPSRAVATWLALDAALEAGQPPPGRLHWGSLGSSDPSARSAGLAWFLSTDVLNATVVRTARAQAEHVLANWDAPAGRLPAAIWGPKVCASPPLGSEVCWPMSPRFLLTRLWLHERLALARAAVAVARFAAEHGSFPVSLDEVVPAYAAAVPKDPLDGKPLRYDGRRLWSIGPDGDDDRGKPISPYERFGARAPSDELLAPDGDEVLPLFEEPTAEDR